MRVAFRPALIQDFACCRRLYFGEMQWIIEQLHLDQAAREIGFQQQWDADQVRIITLDDGDVGWLQTITRDDEFFVAQIFSRRPVSAEGYWDRGDDAPDR